MIFICRILTCVFILAATTAQVYADELSDLIQQGQERLGNGNYRETENLLSKAKQLSTEQQNTYSLTLVNALQGYLALQQQHTATAESVLLEALDQSKKNNWYDLSSRINQYLGQVYQQTQENELADFYFQQSLKDPEKVADKALLVSGFYQLAKIALENRKTKQAWQYLQQAKTLMKNVPANGAVNSQLWLNIGYQGTLLHKLSPKNNFLLDAFSNLNTALALSRQAQQGRIQAAALKHLAALYKQLHRNDEAIKLLQAGISLAQKEDASDMLIDLEWQLGKLYQQQHNNKLAIASYRHAVKHLDNIRLDIPVSYQKGHSSFREMFAPIYLTLADLLLQQSGTTVSAEQQALLAEAQDSVEQMKKSELEDYFKSRCDISATPINLKKTDPHAAAFYPISLKNRLEIIIYTAEGLRRFTSQVTAKELEKQARLFANHLRNYDDFSESRPHAEFLYRSMIAPAADFLKRQHIETLVYMPDGALRLLPLAALYDGKKFLIEDYAVVTSPGMSLIDSDNIGHQNQMLLAGMSVPGDVVRDLPEVLLSDLVVSAESADKKAESRSLIAAIPQNLDPEKKRELTAAVQQQKSRDLREALKNPEVIKNLQKQLSLPGVDSEIKLLAQNNHTSFLLNESFSLENFTEVLKKEPHDILHIASHGFFGSTAEESFIMTHNKILNLNQLESLLNSDYFKLHPIDLLTLSACQTAEGDDRSPLGISGVAIKAKVHSALGSLWPVADESTAQLMGTFYKSLNELHQSKAKSLQTAMLGLLKQKDFENPSFWSPFILIGNWK